MKTRARLNSSVLLLTLAILLGASSALAASPLDDTPRPPPGIENQARILLSTVDSGRLDSMSEALTRMIELRRSHGIMNLTPVAAAFIGKFDAGTTAATERKRRELAQAAIDLAPDYPAVYFFVARVRLHEGLSGVGPAFNLMVEGVKRLTVFPRSAMIYAANISFYLQGVLVILYLLGAFAFIFKYFQLIRHDIGDIFPSTPMTHFTALDIRKSQGGLQTFLRMLSGFSLTLLMVLFITSPMILGFGLLATAALWLFLSFPYATRAERVISILSTIVMTAVPIAGSITALPSTVAETPGSMRYTCIREYCPQRFITELEDTIFDQAANGPAINRELRTDTFMAVASGLRQWAGRDHETLRSLRTMLEGSVEATNTPEGRTTLGNVLILESLAACPSGHPDSLLLESALQSYADAEELARPTESIWRGRAIANGLLGKRAGMESNLQSILEVNSRQDLDFIVRIKTATAVTESCEKFDELAGELLPPTPASDVRVFLSGGSPVAMVLAAEPIIPFRGLLLGSIRPYMLPFVLLGMMVFGIILVIAIPASRRAFRCPGCGHVICPSCNRRASGFDHCPVCLFDKVKPSFLDPDDVQMMSSHRTPGLAGKVVVVVLSVLLPGSGQLLQGKPFRGLMMLMLVGLGFEMALFPAMPVVDAFAYIPPAPGGLPLLPPIFLVLAWGWSVADILISRTR